MQNNNTLTHNLIGHDMRRELDLKARREKALAQSRAQRLAEMRESLKCFATAIAITLIFALITYLATDESTRRIDALSTVNAEPDHLVSPDMAAYITLYAQGRVFTEDDMQ